MKGLLRGMVAMGLLTGVLGAACGKPADRGPQTDTHKSPIQHQYQTPARDAAEPLGDERLQHPEQQQKSR